MRIAVYGLGYVGLTAAACLTRDGHAVLGVDVSEEKVQEIRAGRSPIMEPGLQELLSRAVTSDLLRCVTEVGDELDTCDMAIVCVGTPSGPDGAHNMTYIAEVSRQIAATVRRQQGRQRPLVVIYRSTIRPGSTDQLIRPVFQAILRDRLNEVELVYNPEFLREASAIKDYFEPPKIVVGTIDGQPCRLLDELNRDIKAPTFYTHFREAEFTKFVDNTFHALKVAFANEIGRACIQLGVSASKVHEIFVSDTKLNISPYYLRPGGPFGGSCLPKDVRALQYIAGDVGVNVPIVDSLIRSNEAHKHYLYERCVKGLEPGARILLLGLAFKAASDDLRESPKVDLARRLCQNGYQLSVYDPSLRPEKLVGQNLGYAYSHLPNLGQLLVDEAATHEEYDLVIDTVGMASRLHLGGAPVIDIDTLP